jgi:peroxiredoxin
MTLMSPHPAIAARQRPRPGGGRAGRPVAPGETIAARTLETVTGAAVPVPAPAAPVHLQFRRFAGCPVCNLHLRGVARRYDEIVAAGVREVVVFHAPADDLAAHVDGLPFPVVADPDRVLYREFGVESSPWSLLDPRAWSGIVAAVVAALIAVLGGTGRAPRAMPHGGRFGLPADLLVDIDGRVLAAKYGVHANDQWSVDEILALARDHTGRA